MARDYTVKENNRLCPVLCEVLRVDIGLTIVGGLVTKSRQTHQIRQIKKCLCSLFKAMKYTEQPSIEKMICGPTVSVRGPLSVPLSAPSDPRYR